MSGLPIEYEPALLEHAVLCGVRAAGAERGFLRERTPLYEIAGADAREAAFAELHARWFARLGLHAPLERALAEHPTVAAGCSRGVAVRAADRRDEMADLVGQSAARPALVVRITPETLGDPARALPLLRREVLHAADMLDPRFGQPAAAGGPAAALDGAVRDRYRVAWDATVDGRLVRAGHLPESAARERWREFERAYPELGGDARAVFERLLAGGRSTHAELLALARGARRLCALCGFPAGAAAAPPPAVVRAIAAAFPAWDPARGPVCARCTEIYAEAAAR